MLEKFFDEYTSHYEISDPWIKSKYDHSYRVMNLAVKYAKVLGFNEEDTEIARVIGLLHDIGRFEQIKQYHTFNDSKSVDHADYGIIQLFDNHLIEQIVENKDWYPIIKYAIKNHNKFIIDKCDDERVLKHAHLIRDVDKLDIVYLLGVLGEYNEYADDSLVSEKLHDAIRNHLQLKYKDIESHDDVYATRYAYAFDIYYDECLQEFKENIGTYHKRINGGEEFDIILDEINKYIDERMKKNGN